MSVREGQSEVMMNLALFHKKQARTEASQCHNLRAVAGAISEDHFGTA